MVFYYYYYFFLSHVKSPPSPCTLVVSFSRPRARRPTLPPPRLPYEPQTDYQCGSSTSHTHSILVTSRFFVYIAIVVFTAESRTLNAQKEIHTIRFSSGQSMKSFTSRLKETLCCWSRIKVITILCWLLYYTLIIILVAERDAQIITIIKLPQHTFYSCKLIMNQHPQVIKALQRF